LSLNPTRRLSSTIALLAVVLCAGSAAAQVKNSKHDFSASGTGGKWNNPSVDQVCVFCHVPHQATASSALWNRNLPAQAFSVYTSQFYTATDGLVVNQPQTETRRCLSCHDGSIAIDAMVRTPANFVPNPAPSALGDIYYPGSPYGSMGANIGGNYAGNANVNNLSDDHPVSFTYDANLAGKASLYDPAAMKTQQLPLFGAQKNQLECSTCHDVHNTSGGHAHLLRMSNAQSGLCLNCHKK
jgi:predicted CXXCH cytochrome family protein